MRWVVVTTACGGFITEFEVSEETLVDVVSTWVRGMPEANLYIDGELVSQEARALMQLPGTPTAPASTPTAPPFLPPPEPEKLRSYAEVLQLGFEDLRKGYVEYIRTMHESARRYGEIVLERERQFADEAARQRELTHQSLKDGDLLERSVAAFKLKEALATAGAHNLVRARGGDRMRISDFLVGFMRTLTGEQK
jgi:hypothetical protein